MIAFSITALKQRFSLGNPCLQLSGYWLCAPELPAYIYPLAGTILGFIIGSFLATLVVRWPNGESVMHGRSRCDSCDRQLSAGELIPVFSHVFQLGKCRSCSAKISTHHIIIEITAGLIGGLALLVAPGVEGLAGAIFGWMLLCLAALDAEHQWLPDRLTTLLAATGIVSVLVIAEPTIASRLIGGLLGYFSLLLVAVVYKVIRKRDGLGGGDPKMLGAIGCWLGWQALPLVLLGASVVGLIAVISMALRQQSINADSKIPLGSLMAIVSFPLWLLQVSGVILLS